MCNSNNTWCRYLLTCQWNPEPPLPCSLGVGMGYHVPGDPSLGSLLQVALECPPAAPSSPSWHSTGILIPLPAKRNQWDRNCCHRHLQGHSWMAAGYRRAVGLGNLWKPVWWNSSLLAGSDSPCFVVCTPFPISETEMSYKHGDDCSWHRFLFIFSLEVLSGPRPFSLRICLIFFFFFFETSSAGGRNRG